MASPTFAQGATSIASGRPREAHHNEACKRRMESLLLQSDAGRERVERVHEKSNKYLAQAYEQHEKNMRGGGSDGDATIHLHYRE